MKRVNILETTLRDGSYSVDFSFTAEDTATICRELEAVGFRYIEVGHGIGLGASERGPVRAAATDRAYLEAAYGALSSAEFGMLCIPGIAQYDDIDMAADCGIGFIRITTDVTEVRHSERYILHARRLGIRVMANHMKAYILSPEEFGGVAKQSEEYGAEVVYIVDSAGCMSPDEVEQYIDAVRDVSDIPLGFHAHNNLGLAVANSLRAVEKGVAFVDSSLQGLGRSAGNAATEMLVAAMRKWGHASDIDLLGTLRASAKCMSSFRRDSRVSPFDVVAGFAGFHSSFFSKVLETARRENVDPARLIIELCEVSRMEVRAEVLERIAGEMDSSIEGCVDDYLLSNYEGGPRS